jgi:hypothetical protein
VAEHDPHEALIDELIRDIFDNAAPHPGERTRSPGGMLDALISAAPGRAARLPALERLLVAEALAGELAAALAPALATALAPKIMKLLEGEDAGEAGEHEGAAGPGERTSGRRGRKSDAK